MYYILLFQALSVQCIKALHVQNVQTKCIIFKKKKKDLYLGMGKNQKCAYGTLQNCPQIIAFNTCIFQIFS